MHYFPLGIIGLAPPWCSSVTFCVVMRSSNLFSHAVGMGFPLIAPCASCSGSSLSVSCLIQLSLGAWNTYIEEFYTC